MLQQYAASLNGYKRLPTLEVKAGDLLIGHGHPIRVQTMTTTDTMDTEGTIAQCIRCIEAGAELVRITAPSKKEAENLALIRKGLREKGFDTPLVADIHFTPNAAEIAARIVEKVRINPGNYIDKKKFDFIEYTDSAYAAEIDRIRERFTPLVRICREYGTAMRIGTNHGSLSDRIMSRYGDTPIGMVESAMEFLRIAREEQYHQIILSMKSSNPLVMVQAYRLLVRQMYDEFGVCYPLHLGVTEAGDGEDGRIKSAIGIGALLEDGIGDTIRVSLTEDPEFEIPVCRDIVDRYKPAGIPPAHHLLPEQQLPYDPFGYKRRESAQVAGIGGSAVPVVVADLRDKGPLQPGDLEAAGYRYDHAMDKWHIADTAADFIFTGAHIPAFELPGTLRVICWEETWTQASDKAKYFPLIPLSEWLESPENTSPRFVWAEASDTVSMEQLLDTITGRQELILCLAADGLHEMSTVRVWLAAMIRKEIHIPVILCTTCREHTVDAQLIHLATETGGLFLDGLGDGIWLQSNISSAADARISGRTYLPVKNKYQFLNNTAFSILQATRVRISKTEYISCPSCGRTLFDLQETTAKIRAATDHLKGVKIAIMGCIVNGPGEMADADFGYVGSGPGKITLYRSKEVVKRNVPSEIAVDELIQLLKDNGAWTEKSELPAGPAIHENS